MTEKVIKREENVYESVGDVPARQEVKVVRQEVSPILRARPRAGPCLKLTRRFGCCWACLKHC
jgi:hypothetical protein